jgi:hypothetical protein
MRGGERLEIALEAPLRIGEVELLLGNRPERRPPRMTVLTAREAGRYEEVPSAEARPSLREQGAYGLPPSLRFVLDPVPVRGIRLEQQDSSDLPLVVQEVRLAVCLPPSP